MPRLSLKRTDLSRLLRSRPVNRQSAIITSGGVASEPAFEPSPPDELPVESPWLAPPRISTAQMLREQRDRLTYEARRLKALIKAEPDEIARDRLNSRLQAVRAGLRNRPQEWKDNRELQLVMLEVAEERLSADVWQAIIIEARRRLVMGPIQPARGRANAVFPGRSQG